MADELLQALGKRQREAEGGPVPHLDAVDGEDGEALLDGLFEQLDAKAPADAPAPQATVTPLPQRNARWAALGVVVAMAAALLLWFGTRSAVPTLPSYRATAIEGGPALVRDAPDGVADRVELSAPSDRIDWSFAPATPVEGALDVALSAQRNDDGTRVFSRATAQVSASGGVRLRGPLSDFIALTPGTWSVDVIIAPETHGPSSAQAATASDWPRVTIGVIIDAP